MFMRPWSRCVLLLALTFLARPAAAASVIEPLAFYSWRDDPGVGSLGVGAAIGFASFDVVPMFEYVFVDDSSDWALTVDGHLPVMALPVVAFYVGAGITAYQHNPDQGDSDSDVGGNFLLGAKASIRRLKPFVEFKYTTQGEGGLVFTLGTRFHLGD